jgi:NitT/TauT family transport system permease protein
MSRASNFSFHFRRPIRRKNYLAIASLSLVVLVLFWVMVSATRGGNQLIPTPLDTLRTAAEMFSSKEFFLSLAASVGRIAVAFGISALLAIPLGIAMSSYKALEAFFEPIIDFVRYVPIPAILPLFVLFTGIGETPKFLVLFFGTFFQLVLLVMDDADNVPPLYFDLARTLGARNFALIRDVLFPHLLPQLYDRLRVTLGWCWTYLIIAELIAAEHGVGHLIKEAQRFNGTEQMLVSCVALGIIGLVTDYLAKVFYRRLFPYTAKSRRYQS